MSLPPIPQDETPENCTDLRRREVLKVLTAAGMGTSAALFLPGQWARPLAEIGVLPAHAQVSALHHFVLASAERLQDDIQAAFLISPPDANIPILIKWQDQDGWNYDQQTVNTVAGGTLTATSYLPNTDATHPRPSCSADPMTIHVVFAFANPSQGTGAPSADVVFPRSV